MHVTVYFFQTAAAWSPQRHLNVIVVCVFQTLGVTCREITVMVCAYVFQTATAWLPLWWCVFRHQQCDPHRDNWLQWCICSSDFSSVTSLEITDCVRVCVCVSDINSVTPTEITDCYGCVCVYFRHQQCDPHRDVGCRFCSWGAGQRGRRGTRGQNILKCQGVRGLKSHR